MELKFKVGDIIVRPGGPVRQIVAINKYASGEEYTATGILAGKMYEDLKFSKEYVEEGSYRLVTHSELVGSEPDESFLEAIKDL